MVLRIKRSNPLDPPSAPWRLAFAGRGEGRVATQGRQRGGAPLGEE